MCPHHHVDPTGNPGPGDPHGLGSVAATRRRFLLGGAGVLATTLTTVLGAATPAAAHDDGAALWLPPYLNRPAWGADESLRLDPDGSVNYPVRFFPVQKITIHHTASWTPWSTDDGIELMGAIYREHVAHDFGDIGYHLLIDPLGTVYEGRFSGGTSFPIYDNYPGWSAAVPRAVNAAHLYNYNAGNIGIGLMGNFERHDVSDEAWQALVSTVAMICAHTGLDPLGRSAYHNPVNGITEDLPTIVAHRTVTGTDCPGAAVVERFGELRRSVAALVEQVEPGRWFG